HSSFGYLKHLPVDYLKVDGQFVKDVHKNEVHAEMLGFVQRVARLLGIKTVAEFVENQEVLDCLRDMGIDYAQGYHVGKPFDINELRAYRDKQKAA
ncbi:MAG: EAL domain-containing protein, partial [Pseudomonadota bacterium]